MADHKHETLAEALAAFQAEVPKMSKDETAKVKSEKANYTYGYAGLDQFVEIVEPVLGRHGLSVTSKTTFTDGPFMLEVSLLHESGERETGYWPLPDPRRVGPQDLGSAMTYGRRYIGWGLTGTFPGGVDDDGARAQQSARESWDSAKPRQERPVSAPPAAGPEKTSWTDEEVIAMHDRIRTLPIGQAVNGYDWMAGKNLHNRPVPGPDPDQFPTLTASDVLSLRIAADALKSDQTVRDVAFLRAYAEDRALLKAQVSESENLDEVLHAARELAQHAAAELAKADTPNPQDD